MKNSNDPTTSSLENYEWWDLCRTMNPPEEEPIEGFDLDAALERFTRDWYEYMGVSHIAQAREEVNKVSSEQA